MPTFTLCAYACEKMHNDARLNANLLEMGEIVGKCVAPRIHPDAPTDWR